MLILSQSNIKPGTLKLGKIVFFLISYSFSGEASSGGKKFAKHDMPKYRLLKILF